jgi:diguanylate cyclase (GGDEF)-like protein
MDSLYRSRIFRRLISTSAGLMALFFAASTAGILLMTKSTIERRQLEVSSVYRREVAGHLLDWIRERQADVDFFSRELSIGHLDDSSSEDLSERLLALSETETAFEDVFLVDSAYYVLASKRGIKPHSLYVGDRDYTKAAVDGRSSFTGYFRSRLSGEAVYAIGFPLPRKQGGPVALVATIPLTAVTRIVNDISLGDIGRAFLVDADGRVVSTKEFAEGMAAGKELPPPPPRSDLAASELAAGRSGTGRYRNAEGRDVFGAFEPIGPLKLGLVVEFSADVALRPIYSLLAYSSVLAIAMLAVLIAVTWALAARLMSPIVALIRASRELADGSFTAPITLTTGTELDSLVELFNRMERAISDREDRLRDNAARDSLTGLYNHGRIEEFLELEMRRSRRGGGLVSFVMLDIDHFKEINDRYGHQAGDEVLRVLARILSSNAREGDLVGRYGGEEFAVILAASTPDLTEAFCERLRRRIEESPIDFEGERIFATVSLGWASLRPTSIEPYDVVQLADRHLYEAKASGRNCVRGQGEAGPRLAGA